MHGIQRHKGFKETVEQSMHAYDICQHAVVLRSGLNRVRQPARLVCETLPWLHARHFACMVKQHHTHAPTEDCRLAYMPFAACSFIVHVQDAAACR